MAGHRCLATAAPSLVYGCRVSPRPATRHLFGLAVLGAAFLGHGDAHAHFVLQAPPAAHEQDALGDPQKAPPCGDAGSSVETGIITPYQAGDTITITIAETIYHPGHYRIALAPTPEELPPEPPVTPNNTDCGTAPIDPAPVYPVLADGVFVHDAPFGEAQSIEVTLPDDLECTNCTLQVIQFMSNHGLNNPGGCYYHHCAQITVQAGPVPETTSGADESGSSGGDGTTAATTAATTATTADDSASASASDGTSEGDSGPGATAASTVTAGVTDSDGTSDEDDGGCACHSGPTGGGLAALLGVVGMLGLRRRRDNG